VTSTQKFINTKLELTSSAGLFFFLLFMAVVAVYIVKTLQQKKALKAAPVTSQLDR
jgi:hypothetical protein